MNIIRSASVCVHYLIGLHNQTTSPTASTPGSDILIVPVIVLGCPRIGAVKPVICASSTTFLDLFGPERPF